MPKLTIPLAAWVTNRLATFEAARALGLSDQRVAQLMGVSQPTIANWARGKEPIPDVRWLALNYLVWRLIEWLPPRAGRPLPPADDFEDPKWAKRIVAARQAAGVWAELSRQEIKETIGEPGPELIKRAEELMWKMMGELAARGMVEDFERDD
jgi:transcriptional regulator with XRE-family HTH domain